MKSSVEIIAFVKSDATLKELLKEFSHIKYIEDCKSLIAITKNLNYMNAHVLIIDIDYCVNEKSVFNDCLKKNIMYKGFSMILYSDAIISLEMKMKAYNLDFEAIIDGETEDKKSLLKHVANRSNLHAPTFENNFIRGVLEFHDLGKCVKNATYLLDYITYKYDVLDKDAVDIHLVVCALIIAFKTDKIVKVERLLHTVFKSKSVIQLYQNYRHPNSINESYIATVLKLVVPSSMDKYISTINMKNVDATLFNEIEDSYKKKFITISSLQDIDSFWEQVSNLIDADDFLNTLYALLLQSLLRVDYMRAFVAYNNNGDISIHIDSFQDKNESLKHHIESNVLYPDIVTFTETELIITFENSDKITRENVSKKIIEDKIKKTSAIEFLKDYPLDTDALADLQENEEDLTTLLFLEEHISQKTIEKVSFILDKYVNILFETVEFEILAKALNSLSNVLKEIDFESMEDAKKERLRFYLQGLIDDLKGWKEYIFIESNTPDIHYMDDSFVENCATIITFINAKEEEANDANEDDLEFF